MIWADRENTVCFHEKHFESILDNICMLVFSDKLHHVRVKRGENEEGKKNIEWLLGKAFVFSRTQGVRAWPEVPVLSDRSLHTHPLPPGDKREATSLQIPTHLASGFRLLLYPSKSDSGFSIRAGIATEFQNPSFIALLLCGELPSIWLSRSTAVTMRGQLSYIIVSLVQVKLKHNHVPTSMVIVGPKQIFPEYSSI